jgi:hypothetical protein
MNTITRLCAVAPLLLLCAVVSRFAAAQGPAPSNPTAASSGKSVELPANDKFHLYLLVGQSNMAGRGIITDADREPIPRVLMLTQSGEWKPAVAPLHFDRPTAGVGIGRSFGRLMAEASPEIMIGLIPCAAGASPISMWEPGAYHTYTDGHPYDDAMRRAKLAMNDGVLKGILWHQGEGDSRSDRADAYEKKLHELIVRFRHELDAQDVPFIAGQMLQFKERPWDDAKKKVDQAHRDLPTKIKQTAFVSSDGLTNGDHVHFDTRAYRELGRRYAVSIARLPGYGEVEIPTELSPFARRLLGASDQQLSEFAAGRRQRLIEIAPVHLPVDPPGDCNHYGWPIATMAGRTIVVMHRRIPGHRASGAGGPHEKMSYGVVLHSDDGGKTWSEPFDLRDCMKPEDRNRGGIVPLSHRAKFDKGNTSPAGYKVHLHSIGTTRDGGVVAINNHGVFRSDDNGRTWKHFSRALRDDTFPHEIINLGPRILDHPQHGLLAFGNWFGEVDKYHQLRNQLVAIRSHDGGATWQVEEHPAGFPQYEPAVLLHDEKHLFVTRDQTKVRAHKQMSWSPGEEPRIIDTNLQDPRYVDTVDFSFNPVTQRFEIVRSERYRMQLWLWSMDPADWDKGQWRRECRLLDRSGTFYREADGFHPAAAIIDNKAQVQHIFIYVGHPNGPAGVFRITRTLDTPKLATFVNQHNQTKKQAN